MPRVGAVEYYGTERVAREAVARALQMAPGDTVVIEYLSAAQARVAAVPGVSAARVQPVCCENGRTTIYVGILERDSPLQPFRAPPTGSVRLPDDIVRAGEDFDAAFSAAVTRGEFGEDQTQGHSLMNDSAARAVQRRFIALATRDRARLADVLRNSSSARHRTLAAQVIAYVADKQTVVDDLTYGMRDASGGVRNAALRALWLIAEFGRREPARGIRVPPDPFVDMLTSLEWSDRNKASLALVALTATRDSVLLGLLRARALPALVDMVRWSATGHSFAGYILLGRIAGMTDDAIGAAIERKDAESLVTAARAKR